MRFYHDRDHRRENDTGWAAGNGTPYRTPFWRDYARILHAPAFRRLKGKTQLYPGRESDFFRNRLTHSLEVAQVAKSIARRINHGLDEADDTPDAVEDRIDTDLVELAAHAHDIGHPPFGHVGEHALAYAMRKHGGFEGNAQSLRILARLEKKLVVAGQKDPREYGLNLTFRSLAAVLKYDHDIGTRPLVEKTGPRSVRLVKGYYHTEADLVTAVKEAVAPGWTGEFKTVECAIMDIADDIAYSTYDLEDALKAGFVSLLSILAQPEPFYRETAVEMTRRIGEETGRTYSAKDVGDILADFIGPLISPFEGRDGPYYEALRPDTDENAELSERLRHDPQAFGQIALAVTKGGHRLSARYAKNGAYRSRLSSSLVDRFVRAVRLVRHDDRPPALWSVAMDQEDLELMEALKIFSFKTQVQSARLKMPEFRGAQIVRTLFREFSRHSDLLPDDIGEVYRDAPGRDDETPRRRVICDYIAGMTDSYAVEQYARLRSDNPQSIFKPY